MRGATPPFPQYVFMAWHLVKHKDNFYTPGEELTTDEVCISRVQILSCVHEGEAT
jgi:hypothetical protein